MNSNLLSISIRFIFVIIILILAIISGYFIFKYTYPFIIGFTLAFLINPIVNLLTFRFKLNRSLAVVITISLCFTIILGLLTLFVAEIISGSNYLAAVLPIHIKNFAAHLDQFFFSTLLPVYENIISIFNTLDSDQQITIMQYLQAFSSQIATNAGAMVQSLFNGLSDLLLSLPNLATVLIISFLATFFISKDWYRITAFFASVFPEKLWTNTKFVLTELKRAFFGYISAQFTLITITFIIVLIGFLFIGVEYPITLAIIVGIVDIIPYLGTGVVFIPWIIYSFFSEQHSLTIGLSILYAIILIQRQLMEPKILSQHIGIAPLAMLIGLFVGFKLFGFAGLLIGPATLVLLRTLLKANVFSDIKSFITRK